MVVAAARAEEVQELTEAHRHGAAAHACRRYTSVVRCIVGEPDLDSTRKRQVRGVPPPAPSLPLSLPSRRPATSCGGIELVVADSQARASSFVSGEILWILGEVTPLKRR